MSENPLPSSNSSSWSSSSASSSRSSSLPSAASDRHPVAVTNRLETGRSGSGGVSGRGAVALTTVMNEHEDLISRLRAFGRRPVDADLTQRHLAALAGPAGAGPSRFRAHRLRVVAAFAVGLLAGTTGLATAGALPNGAQEIAHHTLG